MQTIFVMVKCELGKAYDVAEDASSVEQVSEVYSTSGQYDLLMKCYLDDKTDIGHFVTSQIQTLAGVKDTFTLITFKAFTYVSHGRHQDEITPWNVLSACMSKSCPREFISARATTGRVWWPKAVRSRRHWRCPGRGGKLIEAHGGKADAAGAWKQANSLDYPLVVAAE